MLAVLNYTTISNVFEGVGQRSGSLMLTTSNVAVYLTTVIYATILASA